jgi:flagellar biogenesis protein FliO
VGPGHSDVLQGPGVQLSGCFKDDLGLGIVFVVLYFLMRVLKRTPFVRGDASSDAGIRLLTTRPIAPQKYISLVEIGGEVFALGISETQITLLTKIENREFLEKEKLDRRLFESGYKKELKTLFIWEAVTEYMTSQAVDETLAFVSQNSGEGSSIVFDYIYKSVVDGTCKLPLAVGKIQHAPSFSPIMLYYSFRKREIMTLILLFLGLAVTLLFERGGRMLDLGFALTFGIMLASWEKQRRINRIVLIAGIVIGAILKLLGILS